MATMLNPNAILDGSITKEKIDASVLEAKQDTISDLDTIRANANKGATALQSYTESDPVYIADKPNLALKSEIPNISGLATKEEVAGKQDTLTPGNGISIENNKIGVTTITESESQPNTHLWVNPSEDAETNVTYNRSQIDALVGAKQDTLQLTVKDNGNIVLANLQGQSKEFMPATPSGDPLHYAYLTTGAVWNANTGYWELNSLTDLTNDDMRNVLYSPGISASSAYCGWDANQVVSGKFIKARTTRKLINATQWNQVYYMPKFYCNSAIEVISFSGKFNYTIATTLVNHFSYCYSLRKILDIIDIARINDATSSFDYCYLLETIFLKNMKINLSFSYSPNLSNESILYMIQNEAATSAITITLHADAYARAMANADIVAALEAHPNVSLASA